MTGRGVGIALPIALAATTALTAGLMVGGVHTTEAAWTDGEYVANTMTSLTPQRVTSLSCGASSGLLSSTIPFTWTAPTGPTPTGYTLSWAGTAGTGSTTTSGTSGSISGSGLSVLGTTTVSVYANYGTWQSIISSQTRTVTTIAIGPVVVSWSCA